MNTCMTCGNDNSAKISPVDKEIREISAMTTDIKPAGAKRGCVSCLLPSSLKGMVSYISRHVLHPTCYFSVIQSTPILTRALYYLNLIKTGAMTTLHDVSILVDWCYAVKCGNCGKTTWKVSPLVSGYWAMRTFIAIGWRQIEESADVVVAPDNAVSRTFANCILLTGMRQAH